MKQFLTAISIFVLGATSMAQTKPDVANYIARFKDVAIREMVRNKIPASITLAQGLHESGNGKSPLAMATNNHFGIKCKDEWSGKKYYHDDDAPNECFRVYDNPEDSYVDHSDFLTGRPRYAQLFQLPITDYKAWANGLKAAGYATNPKYPQILISTIEDNNLSQYDQIGLAQIEAQKRGEQLADNKPAKHEPIVANNKTVHVIEAAPRVEPAHKAEPLHQEQKAKSNNEYTTPEPITANNNGRKEYNINGLHALKAVGAEDPLKIAFDYGLSYEHVLVYNDMLDGEHFKDGEYIFLQAKKNQGETDNYTVQPGESMHDIAQKAGIKLKELYAKNQMKFTENEQANAGEVLSLQKRRATPPNTITYSEYLKKVSAARSTSARNKFESGKTTVTIPEQVNQYRVQQSDTLSSIARKFNVSVEDLKNLNNIKDDELRAGQTLIVGR